ncbi:MAG TPA: hypothetical protein VJ985_06010 [Gammaproteobacteria bacterium]|nr:hypothetical protein [Gammaproteobacteria bacterium]
MSDTKKILVIARDRKTEALRMATGLTLLDDAVSVAAWGGLDRDDEEVEMQLEALDFSDVPVTDLATDAAGELAGLINESDAVYVV